MRNFDKLLFKDDLFWQSIKVTVIYVIFHVPVSAVLSLALALLMNQQLAGPPPLPHDLLSARRHTPCRGQHDVDLDLQPGIRCAELVSSGCLASRDHSGFIHRAGRCPALINHEPVASGDRHGHLSGRPAGHPRPSLRGGNDRWRQHMAAISEGDSADAIARRSVCPGDERDRQLPDLYAGLHHDRGRPRQRHPLSCPLHLP